MSFDKYQVRSVAMAFDHAKAGLGANQVNLELRRNMNAEREIITTLKDMGQDRLVNLTSCFDDARISFAFYAGDGIVAKVIPKDFDTDDQFIHHLPAITSHTVRGELDDFSIKLYPWVPGSYTTQKDVETLRTTMNAVGENFSNGDDTPRNVHKMPDKNGTLVGIDSNMYISAYNGKNTPPELLEHWNRYLALMFPVYKESRVPEQTQDTDFQFRSIHDREAGIVGFDAMRYLEDGKDPIIMAAENPHVQKKSFWGSIFGSWGASNQHEPG